jgi:hypothetical protein
MPIKISRVFECDVTGIATGAVENDIPDDDSDTGAPPGWVVATLRRVVPNPDLLTEDMEIAAMAEAATGQPVDQLPADAIEQLRAGVRVGRLQRAPDPAFVVEETTICLHPDGLAELVKLLGEDPFTGDSEPDGDDAGDDFDGEDE